MAYSYVSTGVIPAFTPGSAGTGQRSRIALAKLKIARLREGLSLGEVAEKTGIDRGNLSKLENNVDNVELDTLARLADALGYDVVVDLRKRP
jgi:predicted transcriptional regulator